MVLYSSYTNLQSIAKLRLVAIFMIHEVELVKQLKMGEPKAVKLWFNTYYPRLFSLVQKKVSLYQDAEEITQQTFLNSLKQLPLFMGKSELFTWMVSIAKHEIADYFRKKYAKKAIRTIPLSELFLSDTVDDSSEVAQKVAAVLKELSKRSHTLQHDYCELLLLKYADGKKVKEIARQLGRSVKSIESDLFRARNEFKELWLLNND